MSNPFRYFNSSPEMIRLAMLMYVKYPLSLSQAHHEEIWPTAEHLDEAFVKVNGKLCYLWRAVDHEGEVLEAVVTSAQSMPRSTNHFNQERHLVTRQVYKQRQTYRDLLRGCEKLVRKRHQGVFLSEFSRG